MTSVRNIISILLLVSAGASAQTQPAAAPVKATAPELLTNENAWIFAFIFSIMLIVIIVMARSVKVLSRALLAKEGIVDKPADQHEKEDGEYHVTLWGKMMNALTRSVPIAQEEDVMLHHNYDGIRELDNKLPPWWVWGFYVTIVFAVIYIFYFHVADSGKLSAAEYNDQVQIAAQQQEQRMAKSADMVTEATVVALSDETAIGEGAVTYKTLCMPCHGDKGQGNVGPNLTDQYWIHGGSIKDIFKTVTQGVPAKGMISWKAQLSPKQIQQVCSYILTLQGTNPAGAKEPQGDLYVANADSVNTAKSDSTATSQVNKPDSTIQSLK